MVVEETAEHKRLGGWSFRLLGRYGTPEPPVSFPGIRLKLIRRLRIAPENREGHRSAALSTHGSTCAVSICRS